MTAGTREGTTVLAIRDGTAECLNVFGEGVYIGDCMRPGTEEGPDPMSKAAMLEVLSKDDAIPAEEHWKISMIDYAIAHGVKVSVTREEMIAEVEADRARPIEDRLWELHLLTARNPCIYLDSGDVVWGYQCWWGPIEAVNMKFPADKVKRHIVPVPEGNDRWKP